jgi:hypothetical protein
MQRTNNPANSCQALSLCIITFGANVRFCRVADLGWRLDRVYFLAFLNPRGGQPDPALTARLASPATVDEATTELMPPWARSVVLRAHFDHGPQWRGRPHCIDAATSLRKRAPEAAA